MKVSPASYRHEFIIEFIIFHAKSVCWPKVNVFFKKLLCMFMHADVIIIIIIIIIKKIDFLYFYAIGC